MHLHLPSLSRLERLALGDETALCELYAELAPTAYAIALKVLNDAADAEDVLQETFVTLWREAARYDPDRLPFDKWISILVRNRAIDRLRQRQSTERMLSAASREPRTRRVAVDESLVAFQAGGAVRAELARLPASQRKTMELAYFEGLSQSEIASATATPLGTVKARMRLAMIKLAVALPRD